jgi:23S rRNA (uracil1939-C5)-methyltransferase
VEIDHCPLLLPKLNKVSLLIKEMLSEVKVRNNSYDSSIMIRQSNQQDGMMLIFTNCSVGEKLLRKLDGEFISQLSSILPEILGYVSCNPATLARDVKQFLAKGYQLDEVQPIDMFPQTNNIENVVLLHKE